MSAALGLSPLRVRRQSTGEPLTLQETPFGGGEGKIYRVQEAPHLLAKIYHPNRRTRDRLDKLRVMLANSPIHPDDPTPAIAWPVDLVVTDSAPHGVLGFLMPRVADARPLHHFYTPKTRRQELFGLTYRYLLRMGRNLAAAVCALHDRDYVIGDVNESNILAAQNTLVSLVDTDSFQVRDRLRGQTFRCGVGKPDYTPPELQGVNFQSRDREPEHDNFGLAVLLFQLLMEGTHPFDGRYGGGGDPPPKEARIAAGHFPYGLRPGPYKPKPIAPPFESLDPKLQVLFRRAFETGYRDPQGRPTPREWVSALDAVEQNLVICTVNDRHVHGSHLKACPWCQRTAQFKGRDPFPSRTAVLRGEHLQPVRVPRRPRTLGRGNPKNWPSATRSQVVALPKLQSLASVNPRLYWLAPGYSSRADWVSILGFASCIFVPIAIILTHRIWDFSTPGLPERIPQTVEVSGAIPDPYATIPALDLAAGRRRFDDTRQQFQTLRDRVVADLLGDFPDLTPEGLGDRVTVATIELLGVTDSPERDRDGWIRALYRYQRQRLSGLIPLGYFDPQGQTAAALRQDLRDRILPAGQGTTTPDRSEDPQPQPGDRPINLFPDR
ncbi:MAG: hypothetical protein Fur0042_08840 [Cyanophyceae cyanobacterium]